MRQAFAYVEFLEVDAVANAVRLDNSELRNRKLKASASTGATITALHHGMALQPRPPCTPTRDTSLGGRGHAFVTLADFLVRRHLPACQVGEKRTNVPGLKVRGGGRGGRIAAGGRGGFGGRGSGRGGGYYGAPPRGGYG